MTLGVTQRTATGLVFVGSLVVLGSLVGLALGRVACFLRCSLCGTGAETRRGAGGSAIGEVQRPGGEKEQTHELWIRLRSEDRSGAGDRRAMAQD